MHLQQVDSARAQKRHGTFHRLNSALLSLRPDFSGEKQPIPNGERRTELADHVFGATVHWRRINYAATELHKRRQNVFELPAHIRAKINIERPPCSEADHR